LQKWGFAEEQGENMDSNILAPLILVGFFAILAAMVGFVVYAVRKEAAQKGKFATELGFSPTTETQELLGRIAYVNGRTRPGLLHLTNIFRRQSSGGEIYMFSLHRRNFDENGVRRGNRPTKSHYSPLETNAFAFVSPAWHLPRFVAMPRLGSQGKLAAITNHMADSIVEQNMSRVEFPHVPELNERYIMGNFDAGPAHFSFPEPFLRLLASNPNLSLHTGGDTFTISFANSISNPPDNQRMRQLYEFALQLAKEIQ